MEGTFSSRMMTKVFNYGGQAVVVSLTEFQVILSFIMSLPTSRHIIRDGEWKLLWNVKSARFYKNILPMNKWRECKLICSKSRMSPNKNSWEELVKIALERNSLGFQFKSGSPVSVCVLPPALVSFFWVRCLCLKRRKNREWVIKVCNAQLMHRDDQSGDGVWFQSFSVISLKQHKSKVEDLWTVSNGDINFSQLSLNSLWNIETSHYARFTRQDFKLIARFSKPERPPKWQFKKSKA